MIPRHDDSPLDEIRLIREQLAVEADYDVATAFQLIRGQPSIETLMKEFEPYAEPHLMQEILSAPEFAVGICTPYDDPIVDEIHEIRQKLYLAAQNGTANIRDPYRPTHGVAEDSPDYKP